MVRVGSAPTASGPGPAPRGRRARSTVFGEDNRSLAALGGRRAEAKAMLPSPRLPSQPRDLRQRALALGRGGGFRGENRPAAGGLRFNFHWATAGGREGGKHCRLKGCSRPGNENRKRAPPGESEQPLPFRQAPSAPLPHRSRPARPPPDARPASASPRGPCPRALLLPGDTQHVPTRLPRPLLTCGCCLAAVRGGELPLPPPRWIRIHYPLPHPLTRRGTRLFLRGQAGRGESVSLNSQLS